MPLNEPSTLMDPLPPIQSVPPIQSAPQIKSVRLITASRFKAQCLALMDQVAAQGEPLVIVKRGKPLVQLRPMPNQRPESPFGVASGGRIVRELVQPAEGR